MEATGFLVLKINLADNCASPLAGISDVDE